MNEEKELKHFCDNPNCPNHNLQLNDEKHYHDVDSSAIAIGAICGVLKTHRYYHKKVIPLSTFMGRGISHTVIEKEFHLCDICKSALDFYKENMDE